MEIKALKSLDLKQQLLFVESYLPDAWEFLCDVAKLPKFDDNDEIIQPRKESIEPRKNKEAYYDEGIS
jgi:hypothetical protein